jgi:tRNA A-37 threonylcarbamoyl transferase component Bud32
MSCPRCNGPANEETLREFGGVCPKCLLQFSEEQDAPAFPNLEIVEMIGQGGMGVVYKARQKNLDRIVALKVLSPQLSDDPEFVERFTREAKALAQLNHPNIVAIHDSGIHDHVPYLVMEFVDGTPLRNALAGGKLTPSRALEVIPQICDALQYAHANGIVHRDIKPENILIDRQGRVKIADFGLAKLSAEQSRLTQSGFVLGTPRYMAPEQFEPAGRVDHRADIYSLGVVFYEMLTGEVPMGRFKPPSAKADVDRRLDPVVLKSLEREPADRYQSADEVKKQVTGLKNAPSLRRKPVIVRTPHPLKKAAFVIANIGGLALAAWLVLTLLRLHGLAEIFGAVGMSLLLASLVMWLLSFAIRFFTEPEISAATPSPVRSERLQIGGCLTVILIGVAFLGFLALLMWPSSAPPAIPLSPPPPAAPPDGPRYLTISMAWKTDLPEAGEPLGVIAGKYSFLAVTKKEIREFDPDTGRLVSKWTGAVDALPVLDDELMAVWGDGKLTTFQTRPNSLTQLHALDLPLDGAVSGAAITAKTVYFSMVNGGAFAAGLATGEVRWKRERLTTLPPLVGAPVVTDLNLILFGTVGHEILDRATGATRSALGGRGGTPRMIQWDQGWATLTRGTDALVFETWTKKGLKNWYTLYPNSTADVDQCSLLFVDEQLVFTTVNELHGFPRNSPFTGKWSVRCPRTVGMAAAFRSDLVAVPTVKGVLFFSTRDGQEASTSISCNADAFSVACHPHHVVVFDPGKSRLLCYQVQ